MRNYPHANGTYCGPKVMQRVYSILCIWEGFCDDERVLF